jgi:thiol:disulfide interchange protein DsbD
MHQTSVPRRGPGAVLLALLIASASALAAPPDTDPFAPANSIDAAKAQPGDDPFAPSNSIDAPKKVDDPFDPSNVAPLDKAPLPAKVPVKEVGRVPPTAKRIDFIVSVEPTTVRRGETVKLAIKGTPRTGFHTYPITQRAERQGEGYLTRLIYEQAAGLQPLYPISETKPTIVDEKDMGLFLEYKEPFVWSQDILVLPSAKPGVNVLPFKIALQVCDEKSCLRGDHGYELALNVPDSPPVPLSKELQARLAAEMVGPAIKVLPESQLQTLSAVGAAVPPTGTIATPPPPSQQSVWGVLLAAMGSAILMLLTPCVFPMIPITVSFFVKQSERENHKPFLTAGVYSLTIIVVLALAVLLLGKVIIDLANDPWMNLALGAVLVYFALSLFGMYDIELPSFLARFTSAREGQGGLAGPFFMALTFTITSFTCTGPFVGPLLASVGALKVSMTTLVLAAFAYSATFAAPFFLLALFPGLLKTLPKSGGWLNSVKVVMGFLELGAALKFLGNTDVTLHPGNPWLFNYDTVLCAWIALSVACGLYLLGFFRLPHDEPVEHVGVLRMVLATVFIGLGLYLAPALWRVTPLGVIGEGLVAFLPLDTRAPAAVGAGGGVAQELEWHQDYETAWKQAVQEDKLLFIDFTGVNCTNCRDNEKRVFPRQDVRHELARYVRVQLYNDSVPKRGLSDKEAKEQALRNRDWQEKTFGDVSTPLYIVFRPAKDKPFTGDGKLNGRTLHQQGGKIFDNQIEAFVGKLKGALNGQLAQVLPPP